MHSFQFSTRTNALPISGASPLSYRDQNLGSGVAPPAHAHVSGKVCPACEAKKRAMLTRIVPTTLFDNAAQSFIEARTINVPNGKVRYVSPRTIADYHTFKRALRVFFGSRALSEIDVGALAEYQRLRAIGGEGDIKWKKPCSPNKITKELGFLIRLKKLAGSWDQELEDQFCHLQHVESDVGYALTVSEQEHWLTTAAEVDPFIHWYSVLAIHTMARTNELRGLRLRDLNLFSGLIQVRSESAKNKHSIRSVPLTTEASWALERLLDRAKSYGASLPHQFLFPFGGKAKTPDRGMTVSALKKRWAKVCEASGIHWRPSDTRHTGCTRMAEAGTAIHTIMSIAGHINLKMQMHYVHIAEQIKKSSVSVAFGRKAGKRA